MGNQYINWLKSYDLKHQGNNYNFFIASHKAGYFNSVLVYFTENLDRIDMTIQPSFTLQTEYFTDITEDAVYKKCIERIKELFIEDFEIKEDKSNRFIRFN